MSLENGAHVTDSTLRIVKNSLSPNVKFSPKLRRIRENTLCLLWDSLNHMNYRVFIWPETARELNSAISEGVIFPDRANPSDFTRKLANYRALAYRRKRLRSRILSFARNHYDRPA